MISPRAIAWLCAIAAMFGAAGCGGPSAGIIVDRAFTPAHVEEWVSFVCGGYNSSGVCMYQVPIHHSDYIPDRWEFKVKACKPEKEDTDECAYGWVDTTQAQYDEVPDGYYYDSETGEVTAR